MNLPALVTSHTDRLARQFSYGLYRPKIDKWATASMQLNKDIEVGRKKRERRDTIKQADTKEEVYKEARRKGKCTVQKSLTVSEIINKGRNDTSRGGETGKKLMTYNGVNEWERQ
jgi:hypothetical protein